ncbi:MAG: undecaprenyl-diphosphate phosphatase [Oscillospiraceae bacterium]|nr:undecaprenyl-diphosphate phosphatase [Oscillospiraceae bacterium]
MDYLKAIFLGLVQGLTEFLPVSSSGHLALAQTVFGIEDTPLVFDVLLHLGTLTAVCAAFWKDIITVLREFGRMIASLFGRRETKKPPPARRLVLLLIMGSLPLLLAILLSGLAALAMKTLIAVGLLLCATGVILYVSDRFPRGQKDEKNATVIDALIIGVCQGIAVLPGLSRSGATISAGLFRKFDRAFAVRFSFLLSIPAILGATFVELIKVLSAKPLPAESVVEISAGHCIVGALVAALTGYIAIGMVKWLIGKGKFGYFAWYCLGIGLVTIVVSLL